MDKYKMVIGFMIGARYVFANMLAHFKLYFLAECPRRNGLKQYNFRPY